MALYDEIVSLSKPYLGIATDAFLKRQLKHINRTPESMDKASIPELAKWIEISSKMLMGEAKAKTLKEKILNLGGS
jgi:hypothetical protein